MKTIYKYSLEVTDRQVLTLSEGAQILAVQVQNGTPCLWVVVDTAADAQQVWIEIIGTGHPIEDTPRRYLGTIQLSSGSLVFHVFIREDGQ